MRKSDISKVGGLSHVKSGCRTGRSQFKHLSIYRHPQSHRARLVRPSVVALSEVGDAKMNKTCSETSQSGCEPNSQDSGGVQRGSELVGTLKPGEDPVVSMNISDLDTSRQGQERGCWC